MFAYGHHLLPPPVECTASTPTPPSYSSAYERQPFHSATTLYLDPHAAPPSAPISTVGLDAFTTPPTSPLWNPLRTLTLSTALTHLSSRAEHAELHQRMNFIGRLTWLVSVCMCRTTDGILRTPPPRGSFADACDEECDLATVRRIVGGAAEEAAMNCSSTRADDEEVESEACVCAALRLGWVGAAKAALLSRIAKKRQSLRVRHFAQAQHAGAVAILARLHPRYPQHVRAIPALVWSQDETTIQVRVRFARYTGGESLVDTLEQTSMSVDDRTLYIRGEGVEKPAFFNETLRWHQQLLRTDSCTDGSEECDGVTEAECDSNSTASQLCPKACGSCKDAPSSARLAWGFYPGGLFLEAKKATPGWWFKLLEVKHPQNRILFIEANQCTASLGSFLSCFEDCKSEKSCKPGHGESECETACRSECVTIVKPS
ncbi:hypothetical protein AB1Y20_010071 [Prymnesium parvum]|uniref:ShKT domain-containing protein n=1 Tax=Prymnesium parvum TaxID=97485 RepID=A0AB34K3Z4_PRYPA